jgi:2-polyprenyl-3-methyl-5-hydroxy-6-metoxy-1,4-benzoquinol methylase
LEVACGTGRITLPLFENGISIQGRDISPQMIGKAISKSQERGLYISFEVQDALQTSGDFDLIFMATNAFQHFLSFKDAKSFLQACHSALKPKKGKLLIDLQIPYIRRLARDLSKPRHYKSFKMNNRQINATISGCYSSTNQIYSFDIVYQAGAQIVKEKSVAMRMYFPQELLALFDQTHFKIEKSYGSYKGDPLSDTSEKQIYLLAAI